jgi:hypothetical protein
VGGDQRFLFDGVLPEMLLRTEALAVELSQKRNSLPANQTRHLFQA